jgi:hypothetical protein
MRLADFPVYHLPLGVRAEALDRLDRVWARHGGVDAWTFATCRQKNGDVYLLGAALGAFRDVHGAGAPVRMLVPNDRHARILALFPEAADEVRIDSDLAGLEEEELTLWAALHGIDQFAPGNCIFAHPWLYVRRQVELIRLMQEGLNYLDLLKFGLRLPFDTPAALPTISAEQCRAAEEIAARAGVLPGRTLVLFPYAETLPIDIRPHFGALAAEATARGLRVLTSVAGIETPVPGTEPVPLPFDVLLPFCEIAGYASGIRSGVADIIATASCRKLVLFAEDVHHEIWSVRDMELGGSLREEVFNFAETTPDRFAAAVAPILFDQPPDPVRESVPDPVTLYLSGRADGSCDFASTPLRFGRFRGFGDLVLGYGWGRAMREGVPIVGGRSTLYVKARPGAKAVALRFVTKDHPVWASLGSTIAADRVESSSGFCECVTPISGAWTDASVIRIDVSTNSRAYDGNGAVLAGISWRG